MSKLLSIALVVLLWSLRAGAQATPPHAPSGGTTERVESIDVMAIPNAPFTATVTTEWTRFLADGSTETMKNHRTIARNAAGVVLQERRAFAPNGDTLITNLAEIDFYNPVTHKQLRCMVRTRVCNQSRFREISTTPAGRPSRAMGPMGQGPMGNQPKEQVESLGQQTIEGVAAVGSRETTVMAAGAVGNQRAEPTVKEFWYSAALGVNVIEKRFDPRAGAQNFYVTNIHLGEPDAKLLTPPGFRTVDDDTGAVTPPPPPPPMTANGNGPNAVQPNGPGCNDQPGRACYQVEQGDQSGLPEPPPAPPAPAIAGLWETGDGRGGEVGMVVEVQTRPPAFANSPLTKEEIDGEGISFCVYQRRGVDGNPFSQHNCFGYNHGGWEHAQWDGQRLTIDFDPAIATQDLPRLRVDLRWEEKAATWSGAFARGEFQSDAVVLQRPAVAAGVTVNPFVGTWFYQSEEAKHPRPARTIYSERPGLTAMSTTNQCLHVAEDGEGALSGWQDNIAVPSPDRFVVNGIAQPVPAPGGTYGMQVKVTQPEIETIVVDRAAFMAGAGGRPGSGPRLTISADGKTLTSSQRAPIPGPGGPMVWTRVGRVPGDVCPQ